MPRLVSERIKKLREEIAGIGEANRTQMHRRDGGSNGYSPRGGDHPAISFFLLHAHAGTAFGIAGVEALLAWGYAIRVRPQRLFFLDKVASTAPEEIALYSDKVYEAFSVIKLAIAAELQQYKPEMSHWLFAEGDPYLFGFLRDSCKQSAKL